MISFPRATTARTGVVVAGLTAALLVTSCAASRVEETLAPVPGPGHGLPDGEAFYFVEGVTSGGFIVDPAEFLTGEPARAAAVEDGVITQGEDLPNDYYIRNTDESTTLVANAPDATFSMLMFDTDGGINPAAMEYEDLVALMQGGDAGADVYGIADGTFPADLVLEDGVIVQLGQVYLP